MASINFGKPGSTVLLRIVFRCAETGPCENRTPAIRLANLVKELGRGWEPELAKSYSRFNKFRPADLSMVIRWLCSHPDDMYDLVEKFWIIGKKRTR